MDADSPVSALPSTTAARGRTCSACGVEFPQSALACPSCQKLVHSDELRRLGEQASRAEAAGDASSALAAWRSALALLPSESRQFEQVRDKTMQLAAAVEAQPLLGNSRADADAKVDGMRKKRLGGLSALGLLLWKLKAVAFFALGKAKLLLLGLTKLPTLLSMLATIGVYFTIWGWQFAVGFVISIYVHEMGHVAALRRLGIAASAPMFVPGFGAFVRLHQYPSTPAEDARVGLAGPIWGAAAALACLAVYYGTGTPIWGALAHVGAYLNLFNLLPVWQLDGSRGFHALDKQQRVLVAGLLLLGWFFTHETMLLIIAGVAFYRALATPPSEAPSFRAFVEYSLLVVVLSAIMLVHVPTRGF